MSAMLSSSTVLGLRLNEFKPVAQVAKRMIKITVYENR